AYGLGNYESQDRKVDAKKWAEKHLKQEKQEKGRIQVNLEKCTFCMESKKFQRKEAMMSVAPHVYLCLDAFNRCIFPNQVCIVPQEHCNATTELEEAAAAEVRNYQKCLVRFFEEQDPPQAIIFVETAIHRVSRDKALLGAGPHTCIVGYPIELALLPECRSYWKKAFDEAENEFETTHKKVIPTDAKGGVRAAVPKGFPYVHVDFALTGGYAHVVDDVAEFPRDFGQHVMAGMCELTILDRAYHAKEEYKSACQNIKTRFADGFDWVQAQK
ncbi:unnamed protein product, partial [Polarella glacialis]